MLSGSTSGFASMAPTPGHVISTRDFHPGAPSAAFKSEWSKPSNYAFTILLLVGGDVVNRALAQLVGGLFTPIAFSFGWVSYAVSAVCSAVGDNKLMVDSDTPSTIINGKNGYTRGNGSWVLGRVMRDYEYWTDPEVLAKTNEIIKAKKERFKMKDPPRQAGLVVSFWEPSTTLPSGEPGHDLVYWSGLVVEVVQLGIAAIPCGVYGDWCVLLVTAAAILLCLATGSLKQWRVEKWACRRLGENDKKPYVLTRGNGAQHAIVILGNGHGLDLEDLATGFANLDPPSITIFARLAVLALGILWVALLITSSAISDQAWFLIAVGGIGMLQNVFVAAWRRRPEAFGLPLVYKGVIGNEKVMKTLMDVERRHKKLGKSMVPTFFPGDMFPNEIKEWEDIAEEWKIKEKEQQAKA